MCPQCGSFIRQSLPLEPSFHTKALDSLLRGVAIETSELFRQFHNGLAKILGMAEEPQLQDVRSDRVGGGCAALRLWSHVKVFGKTQR